MNMPEEEQSSLEKIILAGVGAITKTAETAGEMLEELVKKGELTVEQGKALNEELKHNVKEKVGDTTQNIKDKVGDTKENIKGKVSDVSQKIQSSAVSGFVANMDQLTPEELAVIRAKIDELENTKGDEE